MIRFHRLRWARQSKRHVAHLTWKYFADPAHGHPPGADKERRRISACEIDFPVQEFLDEQPSNEGWRFCQLCLDAIAQVIEQTMPGGP